MEQLFLRPVKLLLAILFSLFAVVVQAQETTAVRQRSDTTHATHRRDTTHRRITTVHKITPVHRTDSLAKLIDSLRRDSILRDSVRRDSLAKDSVMHDAALPIRPVRKDSLHPVLRLPFASDSFVFKKQPFFSFTNPVRYTISEKQWEGKEVLFYSVVALLIIFALIKNAFRRYLTDLFSSYFRTTMRQRQIKEQLLQSPLPSLLFNILFVLSGGVFSALLLQHFAIGTRYPFWLLAAYCAIGLAIIYTGKFLLLKFLGWAFQMSAATDTYIFVVFSTMKVMGILLLPFSILMAFTYGAVNAAAVTLSLVVVICLFLYRYFLSYISIYPFLRIQLFHMLIYLAAFEIIPVLLINKLLFLFLNGIL